MNHKKIYTERIEIKISKEQKKLVERKCKERELTANQYIRNCIDESEQ